MVLNNKAKKIKVIIDPQIFSQKYGGISRLFVEVISSLKNSNTVAIDLPVIYSPNEYLKSQKFNPTLIYILFRSKLIFRFFSKIFKTKKLLRLNILYTKFKLLFFRYDIILPTYYDSYFLAYKKRHTKVITVVFDLIHENYISKSKDVSRTLQQKNILFLNSDYFISISNFTKNDLLRYYNFIKKETVHVVYLAHSSNTSQKINFNFQLPKKYLLFVGQRKSYKNFDWFISKISKWLISKNVQLICCGGNDFDLTEKQMLAEFQISDRVHQRNVTEFELNCLYKNALAFIYPSLYEGFGIPILEAMSNNCPVLTTKLTSFPEVGEDAVCYFNTDDDSLLEGLDEILFNQKFRSLLVDKAAKHVLKFSWIKTANEFERIFMQINTSIFK